MQNFNLLKAWVEFQGSKKWLSVREKDLQGFEAGLDFSEESIDAFSKLGEAEVRKQLIAGGVELPAEDDEPTTPEEEARFEGAMVVLTCIKEAFQDIAEQGKKAAGKALEAVQKVAEENRNALEQFPPKTFCMDWGGLPAIPAKPFSRWDEAEKLREEWFTSGPPVRWRIFISDIVSLMGETLENREEAAGMILMALGLRKFRYEVLDPKDGFNTEGKEGGGEARFQGRYLGVWLNDAPLSEPMFLCREASVAQQIVEALKLEDVVGNRVDVLASTWLGSGADPKRVYEFKEDWDGVDG